MKVNCQPLHVFLVVLFITSSALCAPLLSIESQDSTTVERTLPSLESVSSGFPSDKRNTEVAVSKRLSRLQTRKPPSKSQQKAISIGVGVAIGAGFMVFVCCSITGCGHKNKNDPRISNKGRKANRPYQSADRQING